jgi:hypothetical protein
MTLLPLDETGWQVHLNQVKSFEKLTAGGLEPDADQYRLL